MRRTFIAIALAVVGTFGCAENDEPRHAASCSPSCAAGQVCCPSAGASACRSVASDPMNCGGCGFVCAAGLRCVGAMCMPGTTTDSGPVTPRPDGGVVTGDCTPTCSSASTCCGTQCVERSVPVGTNGRDNTSFDHCGDCDNACDPERASACSTATTTGSSGPQCMCGSLLACATGSICVRAGASYTCANLMTDRNNCGTPGHVCPGDESCSGGTCVCGTAACPAGRTCCGGACVDTMTDAMHCGSCTTVCGESATSCSGGTCRCGTAPACAFASGMSLGQLCCGDRCVAQNDANCGGCGMTCDPSSGYTCVYGLDLTATMMVCCGTPPPIPGFPAVCGLPF